MGYALACLFPALWFTCALGAGKSSRLPGKKGRLLAFPRHLRDGRYVTPEACNIAALLEAARGIIALRYRPQYHEIGAAVCTRSGEIFAAVNLDATLGRVAVCAEAIALGMAAAQGDTDIEAMVAVNARGDVVSPCGMCREMISDYSPSAKVLLQAHEGLEIVPVNELLPRRYRKGIP